MRLSPALFDAAVDAFDAVWPLQHPADASLHEFFGAHRQLGARDRAFIAESIFGCLRHILLLQYVTERATPRSMLLAHLVRFQGVSVRELEPLLRGDERTWLARLKAAIDESLPLSVQAELPEWIIERLRQVMPEAAIVEAGRAMQSAAPLDLRVNSLLAQRDEVLAALRADGIEGTPTRYSPMGVRIEHKPAINRHHLFLEGKIEVQDEGSQLLGFLLAPRRREMVVDFCAGAGGKTLLLGALMHSHGRLYAFDVSDKRLARMRPRLKRSGLSNVHVQHIQGESDGRLKRLAGKIDRVLVDAPCSGLGTLRRNPDLKLRQTAVSVAELTRKQAAIIDAAARLVKPGGRLVYATCSLLREENQDIVSGFLQRNAGFDLLDCARIFSEQKIALDTGEYLQLSPQAHGTDGFFAAALQRKKDTA